MIQKSIWLFLFLSISLILVAGSAQGKTTIPSYNDLKCDDHGVLSFTRSYDLNPVKVISPKGEVIIVPGHWGYSKFFSQESTLITPGKYFLLDNDYGNRTVICPGVRLSCAWAEINVQECAKSAHEVQAVITAVNVSLSDLQYTLFIEGTGRTLSHRKGSVSTQLENLKVTAQNSNSYLISVPNLSGITAFEVSIPDCIGRAKVYSRRECTLNSVGAVSTLGSISQCDDFPTREARLNCAKRVLKLGDIITEKSNCNALDSGKRENCNKELKQKNYNLIKFRFHNLELEVKKLVRAGKLTENEVASFTSNLEQSKTAFDLANNKEERKQIIMQVRQSWIELMRKVKE